MARNELFGIDVEEKEVKIDERVEKKEEKAKIGEVRISDKLTFKTGDDAEIKEFLKKVIDTEDYDEEFRLIVNEWIERKIEKTGGCKADEILFAHRYIDNLEGHEKNELKTVMTNTWYNKNYFITNSGLKVTHLIFNYDYPQFAAYSNNGVIKKSNGKIDKSVLVTKISLKKIDAGLVLKIKNTKNLNIDNYSYFGNYIEYSDFIKFKFITKDDINKLLNDLLGMTKLVITERNSNNNVVDDFFG